MFFLHPSSFCSTSKNNKINGLQPSQSNDETDTLGKGWALDLRK
jgi:hypothetical protein